MRPARWIFGVSVAMVLLAVGWSVFTAPSEEPATPRRPDSADVAGSPTPPAPPRSDAPDVSRTVTGWWSWALLDRESGQIVGSDNHATEVSSTESMVKAWLAADYLRHVAQRGTPLTDAEAGTIRAALRVSDDQAAESLYQTLGGTASIHRMITTCGLTNTQAYPWRWALTEITARDAARLGDCLADGRMLTDAWTAWLRQEMRQVAPSNAFGIREAFPPDQAAEIAVKNGWTPHGDTGQWHVSCLGVTDEWSLAVLVRYPAQRGLEYGAAVCRDVASQLFAPSAATSAEAPSEPIT